MAQIAGLAAGVLMLAGTAQAASYTVVSGDSLYKISVRNNTTVSELMQQNRLVSDVIYPGQNLQIPDPVVYQVKNDESMWDISQKFGIPLDALIKANPQIQNPGNIWNGLKIYIPRSSSSTVKPSQLADGQFPLGKGTYQTPIDNNFNDGRSWSPDGAAARTHEGVDIFAEKGTPIYSVLDGEIINYGWNQYGGWRVTVRVNDSTVLYYAHLSRYAPGIGKGSLVKKGQLIGYVGSTGYGPEGTEGEFLPHLHFGIYKTNAPSWYAIDPFPYLQWWEANR